MILHCIVLVLLYFIFFNFKKAKRSGNKYINLFFYSKRVYSGYLFFFFFFLSSTYATQRSAKEQSERVYMINRFIFVICVRVSFFVQYNNSNNIVIRSNIAIVTITIVVA